MPQCLGTPGSTDYITEYDRKEFEVKPPLDRIQSSKCQCWSSISNTWIYIYIYYLHLM